MTKKTGKDAGAQEGKDALETITHDDIDLGDQGKSDEELWRELDASEGEKAADEGTDQAATKDTDAEGDEPAADHAEEAAEGEPDKSAADPADKDASAKNGDGTPDKKTPDKQAQPPATEKEPTLAELKAERDRLIEENRKLEHADRSNRQRVSALQRKLDARGVGSPQGKKAPPAKKEPFADDKGKAFKQEYPEVAEPVAKELTEVRAELEDLKAERAKRAEAEETARLKKNEAVLDGKHPEWEKRAAEPDFGDWLLKQPRYVQEAARRNFDAIVDAEEAVDLFDRYEAFRSSQAGGEQNTQQQGKGKPGAHDGPDANGNNGGGKNGNSLSGKRQRQLDSSLGTRSTGPGLVDGIPEDADYEATWKAFDRIEERQERQARRA